MNRMRKIILLFCVLCILSSCGMRYFRNSDDLIRIGCKNFTEQYILGEIMAQIFENEGVTVERVFGMSGVKLIHEAIYNRRIHIYPEYAGAAYEYILKKDYDFKNDVIFKELKEEYLERFNLVWGQNSKLNNSSILVTTKEVAEKYKLKTYDDIEANADKLTFSAPSEFWNRQDGMELLVKNYEGFNDFKNIIKMDMGMQYRALINGEVDIALGNSTDGKIASERFVILKDNKEIWPPYNVSAVICKEIEEKYPLIVEKINSIFQQLTNEDMIEMNRKIEGNENLEPDEVVKEYLKDKI